MSYEWEEEVPHAKPPTRKARLEVTTIEPDVVHGRPDELLHKRRDATLSDIARALGVTETQLEMFLSNPSMRWAQGRGRVERAKKLERATMVLARCICKPAGSGNCAACRQGMADR